MLRNHGSPNDANHDLIKIWYIFISNWNKYTIDHECHIYKIPNPCSYIGIVILNTHYVISIYLFNIFTRILLYKNYLGVGNEAPGDELDVHG